MNIRFRSKISSALCGALLIVTVAGAASAGPLGVAAPQIAGASVSPTNVHWRHYRHHHYHRYYRHYHRYHHGY